MCINDSPREVDDLDSYGAERTQHIKRPHRRDASLGADSELVKSSPLILDQIVTTTAATLFG